MLLFAFVVAASAVPTFATAACVITSVFVDDDDTAAQAAATCCLDIFLNCRIVALALLISTVHSPGQLGSLFDASTLGCSGVGCAVDAGFLVGHSFAKCPAAPQAQQ